MGKVLLEKGETQLALGMLQQALKRDSNNVMAHHLAGTDLPQAGKDGGGRAGTPARTNSRRFLPETAEYRPRGAEKPSGGL